MGCRLHLHLDSRGVAVRGGSARSILASSGGVVDASEHDITTGGGCADDGGVATRKADDIATPFRPGEPIHQRALPGLAQRPRHHLQHEPSGRGLGQLGDGELLQLVENRADVPQGLSFKDRRPIRCVRLHREVLQPDPATFDAWVRQSDTVRGSFKSLSRCPRNRQQPTLTSPLSQRVFFVCRYCRATRHLAFCHDRASNAVEITKEKDAGCPAPFSPSSCPSCLLGPSRFLEFHELPLFDHADQTRAIPLGESPVLANTWTKLSAGKKKTHRVATVDFLLF